MTNETVAILGAGSFGTAVALHLASAGHRVMLWAHNTQHVSDMRADQCNQRYLPDFSLPNNIILSDDLALCVKNSTHIIIAVPSHAFEHVLNQIPIVPKQLCWVTKGIDPSSNQLLSQLVFKKWGTDMPIAVISGPSFSREVAKGLPTALVVAGPNHNYLSAIRSLLHHANLRIYLSDDIIGVQLCGAVKNVLAIACGISDGLHYGANAKAALITRGLAEMSRLGLAMGADKDTFVGLAGVGDLVLTCTDDQSRNRRFGLQLGRGASPANAEQHIGQVVEGKYNAAQIFALATQYKVDMPICAQVHALLEGRITPQQAVIGLMTRPPLDETIQDQI
jgi:glycerol-3-phosphate dehydrogenase (NAD(P)+)